MIQHPEKPAPVLFTPVVFGKMNIQGPHTEADRRRVRKNNEEENTLKRRIISILLVAALLAAMLPQLTAIAAPQPGSEAYEQHEAEGLRKARSRFVDVSGSAFYADAVDWAVTNGVTNGLDDTHFGPDRGCTRGQVVTFLWRAAGSPGPNSGYCPFTDVSKGAFYYTAMLWAVENGITNGTSPTKFSPDATCTRGQIVTFLWRAAGCPEPYYWNLPFWDVEWDAYYADAVLWAVGEDITNGTSDTTFGPNKTCTRGQVVTFLYRAEIAAHRYDDDPPVPPANSRLVGISLPTAALQRWFQDGQNLRQRLQNDGYVVDLEYADNDVKMQISQIEGMIMNGAKVLVVAPIDGYALGPVLEWARRVGIVVISYDRLIMGTPAVDYYVTFSNWEVGRLQGEYIRDTLGLDNPRGKTFNIEFITGDPGDGNIYDFFDGAMNVLQPYLDSGVLVCRSGQTSINQAATLGWSSENAERRFGTILRSYYSSRPLHAVLASNDSTAQGVAAALSYAYSNDVYPIITGQDCDIVSVNYMLSGRQAMSVFKDTRDLVDPVASLVMASMEGQVVPLIGLAKINNGAVIVPTWQVHPVICTADNVQELLIDTGYYTWDELNGW